MLGHHFRHDMIKKQVAIFGSLFNDMQIERWDSNDEVWHQIKVPLSYAPRDKFIAASHKEFGSTTQAVAMISPRMGFEMVSIQRDTRRQVNPMQKIRLENDKHMYNLVPVNIAFNVYVIAKTATDANRVIEQIIPFFQPSITISMYPIPEDHSLSRDIKVTLQQTECQDQYEGTEEQRRSILWTISFNAQGFILGPVRSGGIIKQIEMNFRPEDGAEHARVETVIIHPGLTATGEPTTDPLETIPYNEVNKDDDWAFIVEYDEG
jgi:hypothetical protein